MVLKVAGRSEISPFIVMDIMRMANRLSMKGSDIIHLEVGQPSTKAPRAVLETAKTALDQNLLGYTDALGFADLRKRLTAYYQDYYNCAISSDRIIITTGSSGAFLLSFLSVFEAGDKVGLVVPTYPAYKNILKAIGVEILEIHVSHETGFQPNREILESLDTKLDGLIIASPSNPTGSMIKKIIFEEILDWCAQKKVRVISDEIYHGITYNEKAETALSYNDDAIIINSFSKYFCMTGWRLGWMVVPDNLIRTIERLAQNLFISPPTISQLSAVSAFECLEELDSNVLRYADNRNILQEELPKIGLKRFAPSDGAFYLYVDVSDYTNDSFSLCQDLLTDAGLAITPGTDFDSRNGNYFIRLSFASSTFNISSAIKRLDQFLSKKKSSH
ncbi:MAG: 1-aminocyclopropane-1-carboxylate deaminase [Rhodospirillaceae bacterium]|nr:1-aminocyclopropane-1-carboxylate deaminase [Rhodospirillaceae bacterium]OUT80643.1 MAG: 1-aminocyclopropane-1-carboxylate deaminase [Rhodospirillaceae bacterium TMED23]|tara:strand:+ start:10756 stop:11922 length:1167 start_codon:yes stop_codon:yes gene_type:complete